MSNGSDVDVRGRAVVWQVGVLDDAGRGSGWRRVLRRIAALGLASLLAAALLVVVATWSVISPVGASPTTPLWIAPPNVHAPATAHPSVRVRTPTDSPSPTPSPTRAAARKSTEARSADDHRRNEADDSGSRRTGTNNTDKSGSSDHTDDSGKSSGSGTSEDSGDSDDSGTSGSGKSGGSGSSGKHSDSGGSSKSEDSLGKSDGSGGSGESGHGG